MHKTLIVLNQTSSVINTNIKAIDFNQYLADFPKKDEQLTRLINLCDSSQYLSQGYYCSLLAEARQHKVLPSVSTINDLTSQINGVELVIPGVVSRHFVDQQATDCLVYFGWHQNTCINKVAKYVFEQYPAPILQLSLSWREDKLYVRVGLFDLAQLNTVEHELFIQRLDDFTNQVWRNKKSNKHLRWDMAILVNEQEALPPSDNGALKRFIKAAKHFGINAELVSASQIGLLSRYDALFIRETTAIRHHTYQLARAAAREGLVVIDDADSILRCCNKVFLHDAFTYHRIPSPKTRFVLDASDQTIANLEQEFGFPMVLKLPESSFSKGVFKVADHQALVSKITEVLTESAIILVQEYIYTQFDWRIGVLNGRAIYACRYHMARNHWQIYNHGSKRFSSGDFETLPTFEVPRKVLDAAVSACSFIGSSLYGVDIKHHDDKVYVIEVNDNPSLDYGIEDKYLGEELYMQVMQEFATRLEQRGR
ncbi:RimK family protein [Paraglaciecola aquimarina]|uniref:RimK family protein n=1 Tax=Paraglaciecola algarum TaxID=3050085 RepID=A0ABS9D8S8_9ALTE|nr:RimK family protein [Paraglaciecola sp. G1-23]MCF2949129.1 RimK family protein [Paraglaciecola sp. G1-23]